MLFLLPVPVPELGSQVWIRVEVRGLGCLAHYQVQGQGLLTVDLRCFYYRRLFKNWGLWSGFGNLTGPWYLTCSCWFSSVPAGSYWFLLVATGSCWFLQSPDGSYRFLLVAAGSTRFPLVPCRFLLVRACSCSFLLVPAGSCWLSSLLVDSSGSLLVPAGSCRFLLVSTCSSSFLVSTLFRLPNPIRGSY